ncbi:hypothetical protein UPYG_G00151530 [Umbra pygmaea]|uniref:Uncharacterized protein n=1 Tax=Umbra pygmaea TaxID=75934 RepID=A0ABD0WX27_UMBPY
MHWQKSPKEKLCYTLPTVKKLLEQKRKRENTSTATSSTGVSTVLSQQAPAPEQSTSTGLAGSYSDMAMVYERWAPTDVHQVSSAIQEGQYTPLGINYFSTPSTLEDYSHIQAYSPPMPPNYHTQQQVQDYPDSTIPQHYTECAVSEGASSLVPSGPLQTSIYWSSGARALDPTDSVQQVFSGQIDINKLEEARRFLRGMDYSRTTWQDDDGDTILHIYAAKGLREYAFAAAERFAEFAGLESKEHKGKTALLVAVTANHPDIVQDLLSIGAEVNASDVKGQTALHLAATYGLPRVMQVLLTFGSGLNLEACNFEGV